MLYLFIVKGCEKVSQIKGQFPGIAWAEHKTRNTNNLTGT